MSQKQKFFVRVFRVLFATAAVSLSDVSPMRSVPTPTTPRRRLDGTERRTDGEQLMRPVWAGRIDPVWAGRICHPQKT